PHTTTRRYRNARRPQRTGQHPGSAAQKVVWLHFLRCHPERSRRTSNFRERGEITSRCSLRPASFLRLLTSAVPIFYFGHSRQLQHSFEVVIPTHRLVRLPLARVDSLAPAHSPCGLRPCRSAP